VAQAVVLHCIVAVTPQLSSGRYRANDGISLLSLAVGYVMTKEITNKNFRVQLKMRNPVKEPQIRDNGSFFLNFSNQGFTAHALTSACWSIGTVRAKKKAGIFPEYPLTSTMTV
jgi:hypothetical protein